MTYVVIYTEWDYLARRSFFTLEEANKYQDELKSASYLIHCPNNTQFVYCGGKNN